MERVLKILLVSMLMLSFSTYKKDDWKRIKNYSVKIEVKKDLWFILDKEIKATDIESERGLLTQAEFMSLQNYFSQLHGTPVIMAEIKSDIIKKYRIFYVNFIQYETEAGFYAMKKGGKDIYNFYLGCDTFFNKIIKEESIKIVSPDLAMDIGMIFIKICHGINEEPAIHWEEIEKLVKNKVEPDIEERIRKNYHPPLYKIRDKIIELSFLTYAESKVYNEAKMEYIAGGKIVWLHEWHIEVRKNGQVRLLNFKHIY
jgi:hypothetical protein